VPQLRHGGGQVVGELEGTLLDGLHAAQPREMCEPVPQRCGSENIKTNASTTNNTLQSTTLQKRHSKEKRQYYPQCGVPAMA